MPNDAIPELIRQVDQELIRRNLFYLAKDPLPFRKANYTVPGHPKHSLAEADDFIQARLESWGYAVEREPCQAQAFRRDRSRPVAHQYSAPSPEDPWYTLHNLYARRTGDTRPDELVIAIAHKDSQSWIDSPAAYDNAGGTVATLEIARVLRDYTPSRTICFLFCNEEHTPWTSITAARRARERGDQIVALFNLDGLGSKSQAEVDAGRKTSVTGYSTAEGKWLADLMVEVNEVYGIGLSQSAQLGERIGNDDGSFIKEGFRSAVHNAGSRPQAGPNYHQEGDTPELVDVENVAMAARASLAAIVRVAG